MHLYLHPKTTKTLLAQLVSSRILQDCKLITADIAFPADCSITESATNQASMAVPARPISPTRFALALHDLPLDALYSKASEIANSIAHLSRSNAQLQSYSDSIKNDQTIEEGTREEGDRECLEAIGENDVVIERQKVRVGLLKGECERRGEVWHWSGDLGDKEDTNSGTAVNGSANGNSGLQRERLRDEELRRRMEQRMREDGGEQDEDGMHL